MLNNYIVIGILVLIIFGLLYVIIRQEKLLSEKDTYWYKRYIASDSHHKAKHNFLTLLMLETNGIKTGVNSTGKLYSDFIKQIKEDLLIEKADKDLMEETMNSDKK